MISTLCLCQIKPFCKINSGTHIRPDILEFQDLHTTFSTLNLLSRGVIYLNLDASPLTAVEVLLSQSTRQILFCKADHIL